MKCVELLAIVFLEPFRSHLIFFLPIKTNIYVFDFPLIGLSGCFHDTSNKYLFQSFNDVSESLQIRYFSQLTIYLPHTRPVFTFSSYDHTADCFKPRAIISPGLSSTHHATAVKEWSVTKSLWCSWRETPESAPCKQCATLRRKKKQQLHAQKS